MMTEDRVFCPSADRKFRLFRRPALVVTIAVLAAALCAPPAIAGGEETAEQALCRLIENAATRQDIPAGFLTALIWQESSFRPNVVSPAGAQGIAQFMPGTARERNLLDPFDPEQAVPASAALLADLRTRFGNVGLAAAAYNAGPARVAAWLAGTGGLPFETRAYVLTITGREAEDWAGDVKKGTASRLAEKGPGCAARVAELRRSSSARIVAEAPFAPWGVQLAGNFSKARALASFSRAQLRLSALIGAIRPMVIGTRLRTRGTRAFYRIRVPAQTRVAATALCGRIHAAGGACIVLRS